MTGYEMALAEVNEATKVFNAAQVAYRTMKIDDAQYFAANKVYDAANAKYDVAFDIAQNLPEVEETTHPLDLQINLF